MSRVRGCDFVGKGIMKAEIDSICRVNKKRNVVNRKRSEHIKKIAMERELKRIDKETDPLSI